MKKLWSVLDKPDKFPLVKKFAEKEMDLFDKIQLEEVLRICRESSSKSAAGRRLFNVSRTGKTVTDDTTRLRKYLANYRIEWDDLRKD